MSMTDEELGLELRSMVEGGKKRSEGNAMIVLFGIKFAAELDNERVPSVIKVAFGETQSWESEISIGKKLARYVTLK